jgi:hypothetical protein
MDALEEHTRPFFSVEFLPHAIVWKFHIEDEDAASSETLILNYQNKQSSSCSLELEATPKCS